MSKKPWTPSTLELWQGAAAAKVGISIKTNDRNLLRQQMYRTRQEMGEKELEDFAICVPDVEGEIWIVRKEALEPVDA